jgi:hypothetical protein
VPFDDQVASQLGDGGPQNWSLNSGWMQGERAQSYSFQGLNQETPVAFTSLSIAGHKGEIVMQRSGRQQTIDNGQPSIARTGLRRKTPPAIGDALIDR